MLHVLISVLSVTLNCFIHATLVIFGDSLIRQGFHFVCLELGYVEDEIFKKRQENDVSIHLQY